MPDRPSQSASARFLLADDQPYILAALELLLDGEGYQTYSVSNPASVLNAVQTQAFDLVLMDLNYTRDTTGGSEGLELVSRIRAIDSTIPLVVITAWGNVETAVEAMRRGASDFVQKPWNNGELLEKVKELVVHYRHLRSSQLRQEEEILDARHIQKCLLPGALPDVTGYEMSATTRSLSFLGGDYYDVTRISDTQTAICIADVAGKGLPGALLMSNLQAALRPLVRAQVQPGELCDRLNRMLCDIMPVNKFISFFYAVLDSRQHRLTYCNAGHNPPLLMHSDGTWHELECSGAILGRFPTWHYEQVDLAIDFGDTLLLFTDGLSEAGDHKNQPFGEERLLSVSREFSRRGPQRLREALLEAATAHCGGTLQDDATVIVLQRNSS